MCDTTSTADFTVSPYRVYRVFNIVRVHPGISGAFHHHTVIKTTMKDNPSSSVDQNHTAESEQSRAWIESGAQLLSQKSITLQTPPKFVILNMYVKSYNLSAVICNNHGKWYAQRILLLRQVMHNKS